MSCRRRGSIRNVDNGPLHVLGLVPQQIHTILDVPREDALGLDLLRLNVDGVMPVSFDRVVTLPVTEDAQAGVLGRVGNTLNLQHHPSAAGIAEALVEEACLHSPALAEAGVRAAVQRIVHVPSIVCPRLRPSGILLCQFLRLSYLGLQKCCLHEILIRTVAETILMASM